MKIDNWYSRLLATLDELERQPHAYGESDCMLRAGWLAAAQLPEPKRGEILATMERYQGRYKSMSGAIDLLHRDGLTPLKLVKSFFAEIPLSEAQDGDIAALRQGRDWGFGVLVRGHVYVASAAGTGILPRSTAEKAFRVE